MVVHRTFLYDNEKSYSCSYSEINLKDIEKVDLELKYRNDKYEFELAYENGYYSYPRKITLKKLAGLAKIGISTFQEHLRKAELKLLPTIIEYQMKPKNDLA